MGPHIWEPEDAKKHLSERLTSAIHDKRVIMERWKENERTLYDTKPGTYSGTGGDFVANEAGSISQVGEGIADAAEGEAPINYTFKNFRLIHSQLAANPPMVAPQPTSSDPEDRRRADAADKAIKHAMRKHMMQENVDRVSQNTLVYGTGFAKAVWDPTSGEPISIDEETGAYVFEGEYSIKVPSVWDMFLDPDAERWEDVKWVFERFRISWEEACVLFPDKKDFLKQFRIKGESPERAYNSGDKDSDLRSGYYDVVELYEYWETGLVVNGYLGRHGICTVDGTPITDIAESPETYRSFRSGEPSLPVAVLPYHIFTDIDVPHQVWGKSFVEYNVALQDTLNATDNLALMNLQAHGVARLVLPDGAEVSKDSLTQSPFDIVKVSGMGGAVPNLMPPLPMSPAIIELMNRYQQGISDMSGTNESMFGQQSRETSGFSMQYATNQGNMIRKRLFNKYVKFVEDMYTRYLQIIQKNWDTPRTISALGKNKAYQTLDIQGADLTGGFDLSLQYGTHLSLDPTLRRDEMLNLMPLLEKAGVQPRKIMQALALNDLAGELDDLSMAEDRQREIFDNMIGQGIYIAPDELQDHQNMLSWAYKYVMSAEYRDLAEDDKLLIKQHIKDRENLAAAGVAGAPTTDQGQAPGPTPEEAGGPLPPLVSPETLTEE